MSENDSKQNKLVMLLEDNAMDSLVHSIEHYLHGKRKSDYKYVVLHVYHAVELFLKSRLAKHDSELIYKKPGSKYTVGSDIAIDRLVKIVNIPLDSYIKRNGNKYELSGELLKLKQVRNDIEHKEVSLKKDEVEDFLGVAFRFLDDFLSRELGISLEEKLNSLDEEIWEYNSELSLEEQNVSQISSYEILESSHLSYVRHMLDRGLSLHPKHRVDHSFFTCQQCEKEAVVLPDPRSFSNITYCYNCRAKYEGSICARCDEFFIENIGQWEKGDSPHYHPDLSSLIQSSEENVSFCPNCQDYISYQ